MLTLVITRLQYGKLAIPSLSPMTDADIAAHCASPGASVVADAKRRIERGMMEAVQKIGRNIVQAYIHSHVRCPVCGLIMTRVEHNGKHYVECCGRRYIEPYVLLEEVVIEDNAEITP